MHKTELETTGFIQSNFTNPTFCKLQDSLSTLSYDESIYIKHIVRSSVCNLCDPFKPMIAKVNLNKKNHYGNVNFVII